uniref:Protein kinase domain-containing protein n=2 Tax=Zea mays TaxID=4577 RepID=A0A804QY37_MAIZE
MTKLAVAVAAGSVLAALLVYAMIAMKRLDAAEIGPAAREAEAFEQNMDVVGRLRHPNLVPLRAFFQAKEERLLVYDGRRMSFCCSYDSCSRGVVRVSYSRGAGAPGAGSPRA